MNEKILNCHSEKLNVGETLRIVSHNLLLKFLFMYSANSKKRPGQDLISKTNWSVSHSETLFNPYFKKHLLLTKEGYLIHFYKFKINNLFSTINLAGRENDEQ